MGNSTGNRHGTDEHRKYGIDALAAAAIVHHQVAIEGRKPGQLKMVHTDMPGTFDLVSQDDQETMPVHISVDSADIDGLILTHKVGELLNKGLRTVKIPGPGGLSTIFGFNPKAKENFTMKYHYVSAKEIIKSFTKSENVNIQAPDGTKIIFTSVSYKGRDFTVEASTLLIGRNGLQLTAGSVESALCGRFIIDTSSGVNATTDQFVFVYKLHSVPSITMTCYLNEEFYIPPAPSYRSPNVTTIKFGNDQGTAAFDNNKTTSPGVPSPPLPAIMFNAANAMAAMAEPSFRPEMLSKF